VSAATVEGWAYDPAAPDVPLVMQVLIDGNQVFSVKCDLIRDDVRAAGFSGQRVGFYVAIPPDLQDDRDHLIEFRSRDGKPIALRDTVGVHQCWVLPKAPRAPRRKTHSLTPKQLRVVDEVGYPTLYPDVAASVAVGHLNSGMDDDPIDFYALFDPQFYQDANDDVKASGVDPLQHYLVTGADEGRDPCPLFDTDWYLENNPDVRNSGMNPLEHYLRLGAAEGRKPCEFFEPHWYLFQYPEVARARVDPVLHYLRVGVFEGKNPSPEFDTTWYLEQNPDIRASGINPLYHFARFGRLEGRPPRPGENQRLSPYQAWIAAHEANQEPSLQSLRESVQAFRYHPKFSIVVPTYNTPESALTSFLNSVQAQVYPHWELCIADDASPVAYVRKILDSYASQDPRIRLEYREVNGHIAEATNTAMSLATGDYICLMDHDDEIAPTALFEFALMLNADPELDFIYSDEDKISETGERYEPFFKPDWSPEYLECCMYTAHFACYRRSIVDKVGGFKARFNGAQDYDFVLRFTEIVGKVGHVPKILYHWRAIDGSTAKSMESKDYVIQAAVAGLEDRVRRTGRLEWVKPGEYSGCFDVRRGVEGNPRISIVIPSAGRDSVIHGQAVDLLANCIRSIYALSTYTNFEVIVVDNDDLRPTTIKAISEFGVSVVHYRKRRFNIATKMNLGGRHAKGEYLLFLNDDIVVISPDWLEAMLSLAQNPQIGAVGARLRFEDKSIQHAGVSFCDGLPDHVRRGFGADDPGYFFSTVGQRNYMAVTGACIMTPRQIFQTVGGFDEKLAVNYNDIDYCLKVYKSGLRIVYSAKAELYHFESRNRERTVERREINLFLKRWRELTRKDPYYSGYFSAKPPNFELPGAEIPPTTATPSEAKQPSCERQIVSPRARHRATGRTAPIVAAPTASGRRADLGGREAPHNRPRAGDRLSDSEKFRRGEEAVVEKLDGAHRRGLAARSAKTAAGLGGRPRPPGKLKSLSCRQLEGEKE